MKHMLKSVVVAAALLVPTIANAGIITSSNFSTGDDGWAVGEFTGPSGTASATWDSANKWITTVDQFGWNAFVAPSSYLGNQSGAFGGTLSFLLADALNDNVPYAAISLHSGATVLYALSTVIPSTSQSSLTAYSFTLTGANFGTSVNGSGPAVSDAQLLAVLSSLDRLAINADWRTGADFATVDDVVLTGLRQGGVPEPAAWAMLLAGFGLVGGAVRRRNKLQIA